MKREYKFSSIFLVRLISVLALGPIAAIFGAILADKPVLALLMNIIMSIFGFAFSFAIAGGLLRNRMGKVGDYLNQINYINFRVITVAFIIALASSILNFLIQYTGGTLIGQALVNPSNNAVFTIGAFLLPFVVIVIIAILGLLTAYSNLYLADNYDLDESVFTSIKNIFVIGKKLMARSLVIYAIFIIGPSVLFTAFTFASLGLSGSIVIFGIGLVIFIIWMVIAMILCDVRFSDAYLDYKDEIN